MTNALTPAGWYQDPTGQGDARYWNGNSWTQSVDRGGVQVNVPIDPIQAQVAPVPGTQVMLPAPPQANVARQPPRRSPVGAIIGGLLAVVLIVLVIVLIVNISDSSDDTPTPGTRSTPASRPTTPVTDPSTDGG